jgi:alpha-1,2-mannosyltransferase
MLFVLMACWAVWVSFTTPKSIDFLSYWAAAKLVLSGHSAAAYDIDAHREVERAVVPIKGLLPFAYPPPFLFLIAPFGLAPFWLSFLAWLASTAALYASVIRRQVSAPLAMAHPAVLANFLIGQNGFLTTSIMAAGMERLERRPFLGGAILALFVIKPQLGLVLPFAMIAGRHWNAIVGGVLSATAILLLAALVFGLDAFLGFLAILPTFASAMASNRWDWSALASVFAFFRFLGVPAAGALVGQAMVAVSAIVLVCRAWWRHLDHRVATAVAAALLVPPYLFTYDALLLVIPMAWLMNQHGRPWVVPACWLLCFLPITTYFGFYRGPNTIPLAAILCLWALAFPRKLTPE